MAGGRATTSPPTDGAYAYVLRRYDRSPQIPMRVQGYTEVVQSCDIEMDGVRAPTLFLRGRPLRDRMVKLGWQDATARWRELREEEPEQATLDGLAMLTRAVLRDRARDAGLLTSGEKAELVQRLRAAGVQA